MISDKLSDKQKKFYVKYYVKKLKFTLNTNSCTHFHSVFQISSNMQVHENFAVESETPFIQRKTFTVTRNTIFLITAFFVCGVIASGFLVYNFAACPETVPIEKTICSTSDVVPLVLPSDLDKAETFTHNSGEKKNTSAEPNLRLPHSVIPIAYDLKLIPFMIEDNFTFNGDVRIIVNVTETTKNITLHAVSLKIKNTDVTVKILGYRNVSANVSDVQNITKQYFVYASQFYVMEFDKPLTANTSYEIRIAFTGVLNDYLQGFYRSSYRMGNDTR